MQIDLTELYESALSLDEGERIAEAKEAQRVVFEYFKENKVADEKIASFFKHMFDIFANADGELSWDEWFFYTELIGKDVDYDVFVKEHYHSHKTNDNIAEIFDQIVDHMPLDIKSAVVDFGIMLCANDGEIAEEEMALLQKIFD